MRRSAWIVGLSALALAGCGGGPALSPGAAETLHAQVAAVREAAGKGDRGGALKALDRMERRVGELQDDGAVARADADALRRGIGRARRRVRAEVEESAPAATVAPTTTPSATSTPTAGATAEPTPAPAQPKGKPPKEPKGKGKGKDDGKGKKG